MCDPQVRFCERPGGESPRAYSTPACPHQADDSAGDGGIICRARVVRLGRPLLFHQRLMDAVELVGGTRRRA
jgi:hypothetical protein